MTTYIKGNSKFIKFISLWKLWNTYTLGTIYNYFSLLRWSWEVTFIPLWIVLCVSLIGVLYTIIFAGILLRMPDVNSDQRRSSTNSALGNGLYLLLYAFLNRRIMYWVDKVCYAVNCNIPWEFSNNISVSVQIKNKHSKPKL